MVTGPPPRVILRRKGCSSKGSADASFLRKQIRQGEKQSPLPALARRRSYNVKQTSERTKSKASRRALTLRFDHSYSYIAPKRGRVSAPTIPEPAHTEWVRPWVRPSSKGESKGEAEGARLLNPCAGARKVGRPFLNKGQRPLNP